jgi:hypothetical protein
MGKPTVTESINGQLIHEEIVNILSHNRNANQNYTEISHQPIQKGYHQ